MATAEARKNRIGASMSLELASRLFDWSSIALAIGACIVFVATAAIVWLGIVKEHHWDLLREHSNERIAELTNQSEHLRAESNRSLAMAADAQNRAAGATREIARAHERTAQLEKDAEIARKETAEATARALEAKLELEKFKAPRQLSAVQQATLLAKLSALSGTEFDLAVVHSKEPLTLLEQIETILIAAKWVPVLWTDANILRVGKANVGTAIEKGVSIQSKPGTPASGAANALAAALVEAGIAARAEFVGPNMPSTNTNAVHVVVGTKE